MDDRQAGDPPLELQALQIGDWIVDPASREIRPAEGEGGPGEDEVQRLGHKPLSVLQCLAASGGAVVTKDELIEKVWDGAVTTDDAVMAVVYELRKALGDDARSPRYVETIRQRGYRLVADVRPVGGQGMAEIADGADPNSSGPNAERPPRRLRPIVPIFGVGLLLALALIVFDAMERRGPKSDVAPGQAAEATETRGVMQVEEVPEIRSLAIRPLATFGEQCLEEPFVDSLTELLIAELVDGPPLEILSAGDGMPWPTEPTADAVIEGSIIRSGEGLWVNVRLVESSSGRLIWGSSYERSGVDLLLERALASQIAGDIRQLIEKTGTGTG